MDYEVSSGVTESGIILENDTMTVLEGGIATETTVNSDGELYVASGGTVNSTKLNFNGHLNVCSGGAANNTTVNSGWMIVSSGGTANSTTILEGTREVGGAIFVSSGGVADDTTVQKGGWIDVSSGGVANNTTVNASMFVYTGGTAYSVTVGSSGFLHAGFSSGNWFAAGGTVNSITVNSGGSMNVAYDGVANSATVNKSGRLSVVSGGTANSAAVNSGGSMLVSDNGTANSTTVNDGGSMNVAYGGIADSTTVNSGGSMLVSSGGTANSTTVNPYGKLYVSKGGTGNEITENGGYVSVAKSVKATFASNTFSGLVLSRASATVHSGTTANSTTVNRGGYLAVSSGGTANSTTVNDGGRLEINSGGTANSTTVNSAGGLDVYGGTANSTIMSGGRLEINSGGTANNTTVLQGRLNVSSGGKANSTTVNSGGSLYVFSGGTAINTTVNSGGRLEFDTKEGTATGTNSVNFGGLAKGIVLGERGFLYLSSGGKAYDITVNSGGSLIVESGGLLEYKTVINSGGYATGITNGGSNSMDLSVSSGGTVEKTRLISSGSIKVIGGKANDTTLSIGSMFVSSGGIANSTTVNSGGSLIVESGGTAENLTINSGGKVSVSNGCTARVVVLNNGGSAKFDQATVDSVTVNVGAAVSLKGGTVSNIVENGGYFGDLSYTSAFCSYLSNTFSGLVLDTSATVHSGTTAMETTINAGYLEVFDGGVVNSTTVNNINGGYYHGIDMFGGTANDTTVNSRGFMLVHSPATANNTTVNSGGYLAVSSGGKAKGRMQFESGARVSMEEGAILDFDLTQAEAGAEAALVNDLSIIKGTPVYTLTVDADSWKPGSYVYALADGAENFASTISVVNTAGDELGMLTVGETVKIGENDYTLNLADSELSLTVDVPDVTPPVITLTADTETKVLQTTLTATVDDGSTIEYRIGEFGLWKEYKEPIIASLNETYYFMAMDDAGNIGTNQITFGNIDTSGVLLSTLWSQKGINPMGGNTTVLYNEYTPLDPSVTPEAHCLTGCVNTASGQLIYYFIEKGWLNLPLTLDEKDEYTSKHKATEEGGDPIVIEIKSDRSTPGTLSFAEINAMLSDYQLDSAEHAAALLYAIGVVLESKYSASSTGTSWNRVFFKRAGFEGETMGGPYFGEYYWGDMDDEMQYTITDAGFEVLIENLEAGLPVGATYPGHAFVIDGYDRESDRFHINLGWGGNQATRWYTRDEMQEDLNCEYFVYDLNPEYVETFTVTDARVYGTGTMIRAFERAAGMIGDNTVAFDPSVAGKTVELLNHITFFDEVISVKDFNMNVLVTESQGGENSYGFYADHLDVFEPTDPATVLTFHASGGSLIVSTENEFNYAFQMEDGLSCTIDANGMLIWAGKTSEGTSAAAVLQALQTCRSEKTEVSGDLLDPNGWSYNGSAREDVFRLTNSSLAVGKVTLGGDDDVLSVTGHSRLYGDIDAGDGNDSITVDSTSSVSGDLTGTCKLDFVLGERDDHAMLTIRSSASGLCADATVTVDMKDAELGTYTLISAASGATGIADLKDLAVTVTGSGEADFTLSVNGTSTSDFADLIFEDDSLKLQVKKEPVKPKWTYLVYMAADNDICYSALYDIISMQQVTADSEIDIYILADRTPAGTAGSGNLETINGTYKWDSDWDDTRVGKITCSPGLTVTVDWTSWGELDTGSIGTLERFVNWAQAESPAENYGLILWDHGEEDTKLCWDLTTDPDWGACFTVSDVAGLLKEKGNIPLVIFNNCLLGSELVATQLAGSTDAIVVSEPSSYGLSTFNYSMFFRMLTPDMTPQEMAALMVRNVEPQSDYVGEPSMLSSVDVTDSRLGDALEALSVAVAAGNDADKDVLINAMLQAPQNGSDYDGTDVQQSDLGFLIRDAMADPDYVKTSEGFRKALADVKTALEAVVLEYRSVPAKRGSGIAVCNPIYTAKLLMTSGSTTKEAGARVTSYLVSTYESNPLWGGLLNDLCATYLAEIEAARIPMAVFSVSEVEGLVDGRTVTVSDIGGFSGKGEYFDGIKLCDEMFFGFVISAPDESTGSFTVGSDVGAAITVSLLAADGTVVATDTGSVSFQDLAVGTYYLRLQSETDCRVTLTTDADWWTGIDRFEDNDSPETAVAMDDGYHTGLMTCAGDPDYYLIGNYDVMLYTVEVYGEEGWTVGEYDPYDDFFYEADYDDGKYTLMIGPMGCLLVEGTADLTNGVDAYSVNVIPYESEWPADITLDDLVGTKDGVSWVPSILMNKYTVEYSTDDFAHAMRIVTTGTDVDMLNLPAGTYQWRVTADSGKNPKWFDGEEIVSDDTTTAPNVFRSSSDANDDLFFATPAGTWSSRYGAKHVGSVGDWTGTGEIVSAAGKGRIQDLYFGSADPGTLYLTDSENGDALFVDDVFTGSPEGIAEKTARLFQISDVFAGAGDDIVDMTSYRFAYTGDLTAIHGGDGNDVIWANSGDNQLFGDAGDDRIVGSSGYDFIVGGSGNDAMHGGGGDDIFTFCENWGEDTVEQLADGSVLLWFASGREENWDESTLTYTDGENIVKVSGVTADQITLKFGNDWSMLYTEVELAGGFLDFSSQRIFEESGKGMLASQ